MYVTSIIRELFYDERLDLCFPGTHKKYNNNKYLLSIIGTQNSKPRHLFNIIHVFKYARV